MKAKVYPDVIIIVFFAFIFGAVIEYRYDDKTDGLAFVYYCSVMISIFYAGYVKNSCSKKIKEIEEKLNNLESNK